MSPAAPPPEREVPVTGIGHPLADRTGTDEHGVAVVVTETRAPVVTFNRARANLLAVAARDGAHPVLVTDELSVLTAPMANLWRRSGGSWVVREASGGLRNGFDGRALTAVEQVRARRPPARVDEFSVNHLRPADTGHLQLTAIGSLRHPARATTLLGAPVEELGAAVLGRPPTSWGPHEPVGDPWDRSALTAAVRAQMPAETSVCVAAPGLTGIVGARRTERGVEELVHLHLRLDTATASEVTAVRERALEALRRLAATTMPLVLLLLVRPVRYDQCVPPSLTAPPIPVAVLVGAPAVRSLGLDLTTLARSHGLQQVGRGRLPAGLCDLGPLEPQAWDRLEDLLLQAEPETLEAAMGPVAGLIASARAASRAAAAEAGQEPDEDPGGGTGGGGHAQP